MPYKYLSEEEQQAQILEIIQENGGRMSWRSLEFEIYRRNSSLGKSDKEWDVLKSAYLIGEIQTLRDYPRHRVHEQIISLISVFKLEREKDDLKFGREMKLA